MDSCLRSNLLTVASMILIVHGVMSLQTNGLEKRLAAQQSLLDSRYNDDKEALSKAINDVVEAKKMELQALESARVAEEVLKDTQKKLTAALKECR